MLLVKKPVPASIPCLVVHNDARFYRLPAPIASANFTRARRCFATLSFRERISERGYEVVGGGTRVSDYRSRRLSRPKESRESAQRPLNFGADLHWTQPALWLRYSVMALSGFAVRRRREDDDPLDIGPKEATR